MPPAVHAFKGPPMGERTLKKRFVKHKALNKGKPYYSDSPRSHLYWCLLPWDGVLLTRADPAQLLLRLALCWLTRCKFSATHIDVLNMRQQAFFFFLLLNQCAAFSSSPTHFLPESVFMNSLLTDSPVLIAHETVSLCRKKQQGYLQTNTSAWWLPLLNWNRASIRGDWSTIFQTHLLYFVSVKHKAVSEKNCCPLGIWKVEGWT